MCRSINDFKIGKSNHTRNGFDATATNAVMVHGDTVSSRLLRNLG